MDPLGFLCPYCQWGSWRSERPEISGLGGQGDKFIYLHIRSQKKKKTRKANPPKAKPPSIFS